MQILPGNSRNYQYDKANIVEYHFEKEHYTSNIILQILAPVSSIVNSVEPYTGTPGQHINPPLSYVNEPAKLTETSLTLAAKDSADDSNLHGNDIESIPEEHTRPLLNFVNEPAKLTEHALTAEVSADDSNPHNENAVKSIFDSFLTWNKNWRQFTSVLPGT